MLCLEGALYFPERQEALYKRFESLKDLDKWTKYMLELLRYRKGDKTKFRWHDSGDLQSVEHLTQLIILP